MGRILLIEDDVSFVGELAGLLRVWGHNVDEVRNPSEAEWLLRQGSYHAIISDERFDTSQMRGSEFIAQNIHLMRNAKIILLTGMAYLTFAQPLLRELDVTILNKADSILIEELQGILNS